MPNKRKKKANPKPSTPQIEGPPQQPHLEASKQEVELEKTFKAMINPLTQGGAKKWLENATDKNFILMRKNPPQSMPTHLEAQVAEKIFFLSFNKNGIFYNEIMKYEWFSSYVQRGISFDKIYEIINDIIYKDGNIIIKTQGNLVFNCDYFMHRFKNKMETVLSATHKNPHAQQKEKKSTLTPEEIEQGLKPLRESTRRWCQLFGDNEFENAFGNITPINPKDLTGEDLKKPQFIAIPESSLRQTKKE